MFFNLKKILENFNNRWKLQVLEEEVGEGEEKESLEIRQHEEPPTSLRLYCDDSFYM